MASLSAMKSQRGKARPTAKVVVTSVAGQPLVDEMTRLASERADLLTAVARTDEEGNQARPPRKMAEGDVPPRVTEIEERVEEIYSTLLPEHQSEVTLTGMGPGEWRRWKEEHPPRVIGHHETLRQGDVLRGGPIYHPDDVQLATPLLATAPVCNSADLLDIIGNFLTEWDGEPIPEGSWDEWLAEETSYASHYDLVAAVINAHEYRVPRLPKSPSGSSPTASSASN